MITPDFYINGQNVVVCALVFPRFAINSRYTFGDAPSLNKPSSSLVDYPLALDHLQPIFMGSSLIKRHRWCLGLD